MANLGVILASNESRYITGQQIRVDAGSLLFMGAALVQERRCPRYPAWR
ncbi:hypothetical protein [Mycobacterium kyorinense]|nr:hypothetical protein [Mycobacterium kyorinense]